MKLQDIQNLTISDIDKMSRSELESILKYQKRILMNRYKSQKSSGEVAPVFKGSNNPYRLKTTNLSKNQQVAQFKKMSRLTTAKTTTLSGYKSWKKKQTKVFKTELTQKQSKKVWDLYDRLQEVHPALTSIIDYKKIIKQITSIVENKKRVTFDMVDKTMKKLAETQDENSMYYAQEEWENLV
mgnify:CR=1 FL=1